MLDSNALPYEQMIGDFKHQSRHAHLVHFFENETQVIQNVSQYALAGIKNGEGVILVITSSHMAGIEKALQIAGCNLTQLKTSGQLVMLDAHSTLSGLMVRNTPSRRLFQKTAGQLMQKMKSSFPLVRAYGEMVDILAHKKNFEGAMTLERFWNELALVHSFSLLCGYSVERFKNDSEGVDASRVCGCHSHSIATEKLFEAPSVSNQK